MGIDIQKRLELVTGISVTSVEEFIREARELREGSIDLREATPASSELSFPEVGKDRVQLGRLSITHDAVMDWLLVNPGKGQMKKCADHFGFTQAWLSSMVWSDAFQAKLRDKKEILFSATIVPMRDQMNGVAQRALDKLGEKVEVIQDPKVLLDVADKLLHRLGYAPKVDMNPGAAVSNTQNNFYNVSPDLLAQARENAKKGDLNNARTQSALPSPAGIPANGDRLLGEVTDLTPGIHNEETQGTEEGCEVAWDQI